jgi:hypothetical protein
LVAEGDLETLTEWILATDGIQDSSVTPVLASPQFWRARILNYTIQSQSYWTRNPLLLEDSARTYLTVIREAEALRAPNGIIFSQAMPALWLSDMLCRTVRSPSVTASTFHAVEKYLPVWKQHKQDLEVSKARMALQRPEHPDATLALRLLRNHDDFAVDETLRRAFNPRVYASASTGFFFFLYTARMLAKSGRIKDARWVLDFGRAR